MLLAHVPVVIFFAHVRLTIGADCPLEQALRFLAEGFHIQQGGSGEQKLTRLSTVELRCLFQSSVRSHISISLLFTDGSRSAIIGDGTPSGITPETSSCVFHADPFVAFPIYLDIQLDGDRSSGMTPEYRRYRKAATNTYMEHVSYAHIRAGSSRWSR